jgi:FMN phosphatase YigB (HAD superfamily)
MYSLLQVPRISGIVFDLDGTLYLQEPVRRAMMWRLLRTGMGHPVSTWREWRAVYHYRRAQEYLRKRPDPLAEAQLSLACEKCGQVPEQAARAIARWMEDAPLDILARHLRPGIVELLEAAKNQGIRLGVLSDYPAEKKLRALRLEPYFSVVLSAQDARIGTLKPSPKGLLVMLAGLEVKPEGTVYVGDRASVDGETAHRAGVAGVILGKPQGSAGQGWVGVPDVPSLRALLAI